MFHRKNENFTLTEKKFRQITYLVLFIVKTLLSRNFCQKCETKSQQFPNCGVEKWEILSHWKKISSNQLFSNFFSKTIVFTKFLRKKCEREFLQFPHCAMWNSISLKKIRQINSYQILSWKRYFHEIFAKKVWERICAISTLSICRFWICSMLSHFTLFMSDFALLESSNLISRKIWVTEKFCNFQTVRYTVWKLHKFSLTLFSQKFRESNVFTKEFAKKLIWRIFFQWERISRFSTRVP